MSGWMLQVGKPAPAFTTTALLNETFRELSLDEFKGKYVVLFFYPNNCVGWSFAEVFAFSERLDEFNRINCEVLGVSGATDVMDNQVWWEWDWGLGDEHDFSESIKYPMLYDITHKISTDYGFPTTANPFGESHCGLFIIDDKGILVHISISQDDAIPSVDETLRLVQASQFGDKHGAACPAGSAACSLALLRARQLGPRQLRLQLGASWSALRRPATSSAVATSLAYQPNSSHETVTQAAAVNMSRRALQINDPAPNFTTEALLGTTFKKVAFSNVQIERQYIVLIFYPANLTVVCLDEIIAFSDRVAEFDAINCKVLGVSAAPSVFIHLACLNERRKVDGMGPIKLPLLDDTNHKIAADYGMHTSDGMSSRGLIIIDDEACVRHIMISHFLVNRSVDETLRLIKELQVIN